MSEEEPVIPKTVNEELFLAESLQPKKIVVSDSLPIGTDESATPSSGPTAYRLDLEGGKIEVKGSDIGVVVTPNVQALAALRPVEAMLRDPLGEVARKERRRSLLGISAIAILVGWTGLVPAKIENFGISFAAPERKALLWVFVAVVLYYTVARPVLRPPAGRELLDIGSVSANPRAHRATRVAPHVIESPTLGPGTMRGGGRSSGGVPEQDRQGDETHRHGAADGPCVASMTSLNVPERMNELSDGAIRAFNTTTVSRHGSILEIPVEAYFAIPGLQLGAVEEKLAVIVRANQELEKFHRGRAAATPTA